MKYTKIYVGSNNVTKELEIEKIKEVMITAQQGYTIIEAMGIWKGEEEKTAIIEIYGNYNLAIVGELKKELNQDSIMVVEDYKQINFI